MNETFEEKQYLKRQADSLIQKSETLFSIISKPWQARHKTTFASNRREKY